MFSSGDYVVYGNSGLCQISEITTLDFSDADRLYYCVIPVNNQKSKIFVPVGQTKVIMRKPISVEEAEKLMGELEELDEIQTANDRTREEKYKEVMRTDDCREWCRLIKTMYSRKKERLAKGRKVTAMDERYMKAAKENLYGELSYVLNRDRDDIDEFIRSRIGD